MKDYTEEAKALRHFVAHVDSRDLWIDRIDTALRAAHAAGLEEAKTK